MFIWSELSNNLKWKALNTIVLDKAGKDNNITLNCSEKQSYNELLVSYGQQNAAQSYGGGTIVLSDIEDKPCFLPVYIGSKIKAIVYIHYNCNNKQLTVYSETLDVPALLLNVYYR